jgi:hypothetical protein
LTCVWIFWQDTSAVFAFVSLVAALVSLVLAADALDAAAVWLFLAFVADVLAADAEDDAALAELAAADWLVLAADALDADADADDADAVARSLLYSAQDFDDCVFPVELSESFSPSGELLDSAHALAVSRAVIASFATVRALSMVTYFDVPGSQ